MGKPLSAQEAFAPYLKDTFSMSRYGLITTLMEDKNLHRGLLLCYGATIDLGDQVHRHEGVGDVVEQLQIGPSGVAVHRTTSIKGEHFSYETQAVVNNDGVMLYTAEVALRPMKRSEGDTNPTDAQLYHMQEEQHFLRYLLKAGNCDEGRILSDTKKGLEAALQRQRSR